MEGLCSAPLQQPHDWPVQICARGLRSGVDQGLSPLTRASSLALEALGVGLRFISFTSRHLVYPRTVLGFQTNETVGGRIKPFLSVGVSTTHHASSVHATVFHIDSDYPVEYLPLFNLFPSISFTKVNEWMNECITAFDPDRTQMSNQRAADHNRNGSQTGLGIISGNCCYNFLA